jgi:hypothetical protein
MKGIRPPKQDRPIPPKDSLLNVLWQVEYQVRNGKRYGQWLCQCKCGTTRKVLRVRIQNGHTRSCGCMHRKAAKQNIRTCLRKQKERSLANAQ